MPQRIVIAALAVLLICGLGAAGARAGDAQRGRAKAEAVCVNCHGVDGVSQQPDAPNLSGQVEAYLVAQLKAFRDGTRRAEQMDVVAKSLSDADIENVAAWYARIPITVQAPE